MPSKHKRCNARFPPARIKKIMQKDEDIGKVAAPVPIIISRALELFIESLLSKTNEVTTARKAKTLTTSHIKYIISSEATFDFLKDLVADVPDGHVTEQNGETPSAGASNSSQSRHRARERNTAVGGESEVPKKRRGRNKKTEIRASSTESDSLTEDADTDCGGSDTCEATETDDEVNPVHAANAPSSESNADYANVSHPVDMSVRHNMMPSSYPRVPFAGGNDSVASSMQYPGTSYASNTSYASDTSYASSTSYASGDAGMSSYANLSTAPVPPFSSYSPYGAVPFGSAGMMPGELPVHPCPVVPSRDAMSSLSGAHPNDLTRVGERSSLHQRPPNFPFTLPAAPGFPSGHMTTRPSSTVSRPTTDDDYDS